MADSSAQSSQPKASVVIPARNEARCIARTLGALFSGTSPGDFEVIVACDGCTDGTADVVRGLGLAVKVLEIPPMGKPAALRAAEASTAVFPRVYLDADVEVSGSTVLRAVEALRSGAVAARPSVQFYTEGASVLVRRYYTARMRIPSITKDLCGGGIYALSASARARFEEFPDVIADDLFVARTLRSEDVEIVPGEPALVTAPRTATALLRVLSRIYRGNREIHRNWPRLERETLSQTVRELLRQLRDPVAWMDVIIYLGFSLLGRLVSTLPQNGWERDETSRTLDRASQHQRGRQPCSDDPRTAGLS